MRGDLQPPVDIEDMKLLQHLLALSTVREAKWTKGKPAILHGKAVLHFATAYTVFNSADNADGSEYIQKQKNVI